jgi:hypothetical protein
MLAQEETQAVHSLPDAFVDLIIFSEKCFTHLNLHTCEGPQRNPVDGAVGALGGVANDDLREAGDDRHDGEFAPPGHMPRVHEQAHAGGQIAVKLLCVRMMWVVLQVMGLQKLVDSKDAQTRKAFNNARFVGRDERGRRWRIRLMMLQDDLQTLVNVHFFKIRKFLKSAKEYGKWSFILNRVLKCKQLEPKVPESQLLG